MDHNKTNCYYIKNNYKDYIVINKVQYNLNNLQDITKCIDKYKNNIIYDILYYLVKYTKKYQKILFIINKYNSYITTNDLYSLKEETDSIEIKHILENVIYDRTLDYSTKKIHCLELTIEQNEQTIQELKKQLELKDKKINELKHIALSYESIIHNQQTIIQHYCAENNKHINIITQLKQEYNKKIEDINYYKNKCRTLHKNIHTIYEIIDNSEICLKKN